MEKLLFCANYWRCCPYTQDTLVFLGDCLDRGEDSVATILALQELKRSHPACIFLRGNHEDAWLACQRKAWSEEHASRSSGKHQMKHCTRYLARVQWQSSLRHAVSNQQKDVIQHDGIPRIIQRSIVNSNFLQACSSPTFYNKISSFGKAA